MLEVGKRVKVARVLVSSPHQVTVYFPLLGKKGTIIDGPDEKTGDLRQ